jgi:hypothetical protein
MLLYNICQQLLNLSYKTLFIVCVMDTSCSIDVRRNKACSLEAVILKLKKNHYVESH